MGEDEGNGGEQAAGLSIGQRAKCVLVLATILVVVVVCAWLWVMGS